MPVIRILPHAEYCPQGDSIEAPRRHLDLRGPARERHRHRARLRDELRLHHLPCGREGGLRLAGRDGRVEEDLLDRAWGLTPTSRLSCQAILSNQDVTIEIPKYTINHARENH
jgi:2Fe-2S ferredoxin